MKVFDNILRTREEFQLRLFEKKQEWRRSRFSYFHIVLLSGSFYLKFFEGYLKYGAIKVLRISAIEIVPEGEDSL